MRRVVVTGLGLVSPLACGVSQTWERIIKGHSGIRPIYSFDVSDLPARIAGQIPEGIGPGLFSPAEWVTPKDLKKMDRFIILAIAAATQALKDSGWTPQTSEQQERTGVIVGSGIGGLPGIYDASVKLKDGGKTSPFFIPSCLINLASGHISIRHQLKGPNHSVVTACASGSHAIGDAARLIQFGDADVMVAGGTEASVSRIGVAGFSALKALSSSYNDTPALAPRPWDKGRDGFVMGEGAGIVILEAEEHARKRGARIYAELVGYGLSGDAHHVTAPAEDGSGALRAMKNALKHANISPESIDYVNAHGTSTPLGDTVELRAIHELFGSATQGLSMSSTKSAIGHLLGAAGGAEAIFSILSIRDHIIPPTLNLEDCSEETDIDLVPLKAKEKQVRYALSNSFGFGGTNASLLFKAFEG